MTDPPLSDIDIENKMACIWTSLNYLMMGPAIQNSPGFLKSRPETPREAQIDNNCLSF